MAGSPSRLTEVAQKFAQWGVAHSLAYWQIHTGCCPDEVANSFGAKYDLERFGCLPAGSVEAADLLLVSGAITEKLIPHLLSQYEKMIEPKFVIALGTCSISGGPFQRHSRQKIVPVQSIVPVDVFVAGNPPRPEAVMHGLIQLREKICGRTPFASNRTD